MESRRPTKTLRETHRYYYFELFELFVFCCSLSACYYAGKCVVKVIVKKNDRPYRSFQDVFREEGVNFLLPHLQENQ